MKMDSYRRFVRSPLYQHCTLASVEGKLLPPSAHTGSWEDVANRSPSFVVRKVNWQEGKRWEGFCEFCSHGMSDITLSNRARRQTLTACLVARASSGTRKEDPWEVVSVSAAGLVLVQSAFMYILLLYLTIPLWCSPPPPFSPWITKDTSINNTPVSRKDLHLQTKSSSSVELGSLYRQIEVSAAGTTGLEAPAARTGKRM